MTAKDTVRALLDRLPDDCSLDDVLHHVRVAGAAETGKRELRLGETLPHEEVERELQRRWILGPGE